MTARTAGEGGSSPAVGAVNIQPVAGGGIHRLEIPTNALETKMYLVYVTLRVPIQGQYLTPASISYWLNHLEYLKSRTPDFNTQLGNANGRRHQEITPELTISKPLKEPIEHVESFNMYEPMIRMRRIPYEMDLSTRFMWHCGCRYAIPLIM